VFGSESSDCLDFSVDLVLFDVVFDSQMQFDPFDGVLPPIEPVLHSVDLSKSSFPHYFYLVKLFFELAVVQVKPYYWLVLEQELVVRGTLLYCIHSHLWLERHIPLPFAHLVLQFESLYALLSAVIVNLFIQDGKAFHPLAAAALIGL